MLFNSYAFLFLFLPLTLAGFFWLGRRGQHRAALAWLLACSFFYYGWWNPPYVALIVASILFNYLAGQYLASPRAVRRRVAFVLGVTANLGLLAYFKYANFFIDTVNRLGGGDVRWTAVALPLGISFFTFQKIGYLVDVYQGRAKACGLLEYALFVMYFPQLIAGPIVQHHQIVPQFRDPAIFRPRAENLSLGLTLFVVGLCKKVILADHLSMIASPAFEAAGAGGDLTAATAWLGALAYTAQLYFDFSGYSDMAIGLGRTIGIAIPFNFNSPYQAASIIDFWRRWHITLSHFLRDYLYIPLGGSRGGARDRYVNLLITMLLGGLWHGAGWTFVFWGWLHGCFLVVNHAWRAMRVSLGLPQESRHWTARLGGRGLTFLAVVVGWVFFRAESFSAAATMLSAMFVPAADALSALSGGDVVRVTGALLIVWFAPNSQQFLGLVSDGAAPRAELMGGSLAGRLAPLLRWQPTAAWAWALAAAAVTALLFIPKGGEFLYYQF